MALERERERENKSFGPKKVKRKKQLEYNNWVVVSNIFYFHPYLGKIPILTNSFQMGWNHQLDQFYGMKQAPTVHPTWWQPSLRRSWEKPTPPSYSLLAYDLWPKVVIHGHLQDTRKRWKIRCRTLFFWFLPVGWWQKMKKDVVKVWYIWYEFIWKMF